MSFAFRSRQASDRSMPDLPALLSAAAARQAMTPTARAHWHRDTPSEAVTDPRIALFCGISNAPGPDSARFADLPTESVNRGQSS